MSMDRPVQEYIGMAHMHNYGRGSILLAYVRTYMELALSGHFDTKGSTENSWHILWESPTQSKAVQEATVMWHSPLLHRTRLLMSSPYTLLTTHWCTPGCDCPSSRTDTSSAGAR